MPSAPRRRSGALPVVAVIGGCAVCCAGPVLGAIGGAGALASAIGVLRWPTVGVVLAVATVGVMVWLRHPRRAVPRPPAVDESVDLARVPSGRR